MAAKRLLPRALDTTAELKSGNQCWNTFAAHPGHVGGRRQRLLQTGLSTGSNTGVRMASTATNNGGGGSGGGGVPIALCGKTMQIASVVIEGLKPEYRVTHLFLSQERGVSSLPQVLSGEPTASDLPEGEGDNGAQVPVAVVLGAGYGDEDAAAMMAACGGESVRRVPWLRPDLSKPAPPLGPEYGKAMLKRSKEALDGLPRNDREVVIGGRERQEVVWY